MNPDNPLDVLEIDNRIPITDMPDSVQRIYKYLDQAPGKVCSSELNHIGMPRRTVHNALQKLREHGYADMRISLEDTRQKYWWAI